MNITEKSIVMSSGVLTYYTAGTGRPLLYLHPAGGVRWTTVLESLARTRTLYVPVMPGFDGTGLHAGVDSMAHLGALAGGFIDAAIGSPCDVLGQSFGGWVALWLAAQRPERVEHLILEAPAGFRPKGVGGVPTDPEALKRALFAHPEKLSPSGKSMEVEAANVKLRGHYNATRETDEELLAYLPTIQCTTLLIHGTEDKVVPKESVQLIKAKLPHCYLTYVWDAAHALEVDQPERLAALISSFLDRSEAFIVNWGTAAISPDCRST